MGLDMYLSAKKHLGNWDFNPEEKKLNGKVREALGLDHLDNDHASVEVCVGVGYWRKANQIHKWFVDNVQNGEDKCRPHYVPAEKLQKLLDTCKLALNNKDATKLPPQSGFFFGNTEVDEWYWNDIDRTISILERCLNDKALKGYEFEYQSSW